MRGRSYRCSAIALCAAIVALVVPAGAGAATVGVEFGEISIAAIFTAAPGERNQVEVAYDSVDRQYVIHDGNAPVTALYEPCTNVNAHTVTCGVETVAVNLGDGNDRGWLVNTPQFQYCNLRSGCFTYGSSLQGGTGDDRLIGGPHQDLLQGEAGDDTLIGNRGRDSLLGGLGADTIVALDGVADRIDCGSGVDRLLADPASIDSQRYGCEGLLGG
jgi:Ca2+-binding RTX toxin-like protein